MIRRLLAAVFFASLALAPARAAINAPVAAGQLPAFVGPCATTAGSVAISCAGLLGQANTWSNTQTFSTISLGNGAYLNSSASQVLFNFGNYGYLAYAIGPGSFSLNVPNSAGNGTAASIVLGKTGFNVTGPVDPLQSAGNPVLPHVANNTAIAALSPTTYTRFVRDGFATNGDGGRAEYTTTSTTCSLNSGAGDGGSQIGLKSGGSSYTGCALIDWASVHYVASAPVFGSFCTGNGNNATADTSGLQAAAATGKPVYLPTNNYCVINAPITLTATGQKIYGDGPQASKILVYMVFGTQANNGYTQGVITLGAAAEEVRGLGFSLSQPQNATTRSALTTYQPIIYAPQAATVLDDLLMSGGTTCIDMGDPANPANAGNSYIYDVDTGCYDYGIRLNGAIDTVAIRAHHSYPFQADPNGTLTPIFLRGGNIDIDLGRADDYTIADSLCLGQVCINLNQTAQGCGFGTVSNFDFDGAAVGIQMSGAACALNGAALTFSAGTSSQHPIIQTGGRLTIGNSTFFDTNAGTILDEFNGGVQIIANSLWNVGTNDAPMVLANAAANSNASPTGGSASPSHLTMTGNTIERDPATTFNNPWLSSQGSEILTVTGNYITPTTHSAPFMTIAKDTNGNRVSFNSGIGWSSTVNGAAMGSSLTATAGGGVYAGN